MEVLRTVAELSGARRAWGAVALVPTMGALHAGHISLVQQARAEGLAVVVSIFINPMQFNQASDLAAYPVQIEQDLAMLEAAGTQTVFLPAVADMYPEPVQMKLYFGDLETVLEGAMRPGHFSGVGVVVSRLFHLIQPTKAYFGEKDLQQLAVIRRLVKDLAFPVQIVPVPTHREADGLARSSRNQRLSEAGRRQAPALQAILRQTWEEAQNLGIAQALDHGRTRLASTPGFKAEYLEAVDPNTFQIRSMEAGLATGPFALCAAAWLEGVRLIDNIVRW